MVGKTSSQRLRAPGQTKAFEDHINVWAEPLKHGENETLLTPNWGTGSAADVARKGKP